MTERIVWQPFGLFSPGFEFGIYLDRVFAKEMLETKISGVTRTNLNKLLLERGSEKFGFSHPEPADFHEDTAFIKGFYLGNNGVWLAIDQYSKYSLLQNTDKNKQIEYHSHNVDTSKQAYALMALVDLWAEYAEIIKEQAIKT